jgi:hypothetical protein
MPSPDYPITWSSSLYALIAETGSGREHEVLEVCTQHRGQHVRHGRPADRWCQALPPQRDGPRPSRLRYEDPNATAAVVELNEDRLGSVIAAGVVDGFRRARAEQRQERRR